MSQILLHESEYLDLPFQEQARILLSRLEKMIQEGDDRAQRLLIEVWSRQIDVTFNPIDERPVSHHSQRMTELSRSLEIRDELHHKAGLLYRSKIF